MATTINNPGWIDWWTSLTGGTSRQSCSAAFPPDRYYCLPDELPLHLLPRQAAEVLRRGADANLALNPNCILTTDGELPSELSVEAELCSHFALQGTIAWVRKTAAGFYLPFWLGSRLRDVVDDLRRKGTAARTLSSDDQNLLLMAGILRPDDETGQSAEERISRAATMFQQKQYAPIAQLIHPFHVAALRRYYRYLIRSGAIRLGDRQTERRYVAHNEPVARFFHHLLTAPISSMAGELLKPSYVYLGSYVGGAELRKHVDREQCEFSITFCLDFSPEPALETSWPIQLQTPTGEVMVYQALGDGLAYRGTRLPHFRGPLAADHTSTSIFFHYVRADFAGELS